MGLCHRCGLISLWAIQITVKGLLWNSTRTGFVIFSAGRNVLAVLPQRPIAKRQLTVSDQVSVELEAKTERALSL